MLRIAIHNLLAPYVRQVVLQYLLAKEIDQGLDILSHLLLVLSGCQLREIYFREGRLEELNVEFITI